jgi:hypothetical protein
MSPYQVLGISEDATDEQIKAAYRQLALKYHPDRNKSDAALVIIQRVNEAYEILSDPARKARYGKSNYIPYDQSAKTEEERAYEEYKRQFLQRKREEAARNIEKTKSDEQRKYKVARFMAMPILLFAFLLTVDEYLPAIHYNEMSDRGWQFTVGRKYHELLTFMRTKSFILQVPEEVHLDYDYDNPGIMDIATSPIFGIPREVKANTKHYEYTFEPEEEIYSGFFPVHWLLLLSAMFTVFRKKYSVMNYALGYMPLLLLGFEILLMLPHDHYPH